MGYFILAGVLFTGLGVLREPLVVVSMLLVHQVLLLSLFDRCEHISAPFHRSRVPAAAATGLSLKLDMHFQIIPVHHSIPLFDLHPARYLLSLLGVIAVLSVVRDLRLSSRRWLIVTSGEPIVIIVEIGNRRRVRVLLLLLVVRRWLLLLLWWSRHRFKTVLSLV